MIPPRPEIWLITGIPSSGKSAVARALAERLDRSAVVAGEQVWGMIVAGAVWPGPELAGESERQHQLAVRNQCLLARSFAEAGFTPVLDHLVVTRAHLQVYGGYLSGARLRLVVLAPRLAVVLRRAVARGGAAGDGLAQIDAELRRELGGIGLWIDSSDLAVEATVDAMLARRDEALLP